LKPTSTTSIPTRSKVETLRKPSTGLKLDCLAIEGRSTTRRDTQKTQHGIETEGLALIDDVELVETLRKPSTGLKLVANGRFIAEIVRSRHSENPARD